MPIMFRCPGDERHPKRGFTFARRDMPDRDKALADGWFDTLEDAAGISIAAAPVESPGGNSESAGGTKRQDAAAPDAPPTRDEMMAQLAKLGVKVDKRWGDERLAAEIDKAAV